MDILLASWLPRSLRLIISADVHRAEAIHSVGSFVCTNKYLHKLAIFYSVKYSLQRFLMANIRSSEQTSPNKTDVEVPVHAVDLEKTQSQESGSQELDYTQRAQWLRAAVLGANDGLVSVTSLMMGVGAVKEDIKAMLLAGFAGLVAGACSMAIGEFVSVYTQLDAEKAEMKRKREMRSTEQRQEGTEKEQLPSPMLAAIASALAFIVGALVPLLAAAFIRNHKLRLGVLVTVASLALAAFGAVGAVLGGAPLAKSCARVLVGGLLAMGITFGLSRLIGTAGLQM